MTIDNKSQGGKMTAISGYRPEVLSAAFPQVAARRVGSASQTRRRFGALAITVGLALLTFLPAATALAGRYEIVKGKGVEVCEAYGRSLNSFDYPEPMNCTREIDPQQKQLSKPAWQTLDANENFSLVMTVDKFLQPPNYERVTEGYLENLRQRVANGGVVMSLAEIDINNDGRVEPVLRFNYGPCAPPGTKGWWGIPLLVLNEKLNAVDSERSRPVLENSSVDAKSDPAGAWTFAMYDVFAFRKKVTSVRTLADPTRATA